MEYISTEILKLQEYIIKDEEKQFNATSSFGYIQYPSISNGGLRLSLFDEGLVRLYHLLAPVLTLYFDASSSFISPLPWIRNKDGKTMRIYALTTHHPSGNAPSLALFEHITSEHNILSFRQPFLTFKKTELKLFGNCKVPSRIVTDFSKAMIQAVLQEYLGANITQYLSRMFRITKEINPDEENTTTRLHVCSFHFLKLNKDFINKKYDKTNNRSKLHFCLRSSGRLICCINLEQALVICRHITVAITGRYVTTLVDESIKYLQDAVNKFEVLEQLEVKAADCSTEMKASGQLESNLKASHHGRIVGMKSCIIMIKKNVK